MSVDGPLSRNLTVRFAPIVCLLAATSACAGDDVGTPAKGPNVLLLSLDSTRSDLLSAYGHQPRHAPDVRTSPNLDRLAAEGVLFETAYATSSWTLPSHAALMTGQPDLVHGVELEDFGLGDGNRTLAETLSGLGYRTAGFFSGPYLEAGFGFDRGFERYEACYGDEVSAAARTASHAAVELQRHAGPEVGLDRLAAWEENVRAQRALEVAAQRDVSSQTVAEAVIAELERAKADERSFFVFAHFFDPHFDYMPPEPFDERFDPEYTGGIAGTDFFRNPDVSRFDASRPGGRIRVVSDRDLDHIRALYAGDLAWTDAQVGRILARLDELGLAGDTLVVALSDHGDEFFEHGGIGHRRTLYEEVIRIPLLARLPDVLPAGRRIRSPVSLADVAPTVLDVLQQEVAPDLRGRSLLPLIRSGPDQEDDGNGPGVMSRLVHTEVVSFGFEQDGLVTSVPADKITVAETFRHGSIKITRRREWLKPPDDLEPAVKAAILRRGAEMSAAELLLWIDLARHPEEAEQDHSQDFDRPAALAALKRFHDRYLALAARRTAPGRSTGEEALGAALRGLGYGGDSPPAPSTDELVLPPPGAEVLRRLR